MRDDVQAVLKSAKNYQNQTLWEAFYINGEKVAASYDAFAAAGGANKAVDLVFRHIHPRNGVIAIRLVGNSVGECTHEAMIQALDVGREEGE